MDERIVSVNTQRRRTFVQRLTVATLALLTLGGVATGVAPAASADPGIVKVDESRYATPGGHGNFRWRYSTSKTSLCGIYPDGRSYTVRCRAKVANKSANGIKYDGVEISRRGTHVTATEGETYPGAKRLFPGRTISVVGVTCTAYSHATIKCKTRKGSFRIVGGTLKR